MKYRKKPVVIEAMRMPVERDQDAVEAIVEWMEPGLVDAWAEGDDPGDGPVAEWSVDSLEIQTLEGAMEARPGDYIIRGVKGEFYPIKSDIFEATYERVDDDERTDSMSEVRGDEAS